MSNIDETKGAGRTASTDRSQQSGASEEAGEAAEAEQTRSTGSGATENLPQKRSVYNRYRDTIYGRDADGEPPEVEGGAGESSRAFMLQARRRGSGESMAQRKEQLGEALDVQYEAMGRDWESEDGLVFGKSADAWKEDYERRAISSHEYRRSRDQLEASLYRDGRPMSDDDIREVVGDHRRRLEERGAFEGWEADEVETWQRGLTSHLTRQRAEQTVRQFDPAPLEDLPTPSRELSERSFDRPDQIRRRLEQWEDEQLEQLDALADEGDVEGDSVYGEKRRRIRRAREAYEKITVGDADGDTYAFPERVDAGSGELKPRDAYIRHLEENPGDIMGAYREAEDRLRDANWDEAAALVAAAAG